MLLRSPLLFALGALSISACEAGGTDTTATDDMDLFASSGKTDTGYISDQAAELNAELAGKVVIDVGQLPLDTQETLLTAAKAKDFAAFSTWPGEQVKYARNVLKNESFNANVEGGSPAVTSVTLSADESKIEVVYKLVVESLVKQKDLQDKGLTLSQLVGRTVNLKLPADPSTAFEWGGVACAEDPDVAAEDITTEISEYNYFYYWKPDKAGCPVVTEDVVFTVKNPSAALPSYPEFDQLLADKKISMVVLFGQLEHGDLLSGQGEDGAWDWGWIGYEEFTDWLADEGYAQKSRVPARAAIGKVASSKWSKKYSTGMTVEVDVISPLELQDHADATKKDEILRTAVQTHEIVYYNGHSFYGSLKVLDDPANFPAYYQIVFMDSCWSYAYYTKQVFTSKTTEADPTGMLKADVLNNTEPGISGSHATFAVFLKKLFVAANFVAQKQPAKAKSYTWQNLVRYMNTSAKQRADASKADEDGGHEPEVYGVSGVATNIWKP